MARDRKFRPRETVKREITVNCKTEGQKEYLASILENDLTICDGPAGVGKTHISVGAALLLLKKHPDKYRRLIMARPYVIVDGEDMGFLPGDANDKLRPFMMPLLDELNKFVDIGQIQTLFAQSTIEFIPVAHMRGRNFTNCIVIFDEAQNSKISHMKMFLTRFGDNCKAIIEGDVSQSDLVGEDKDNNGLAWSMDRLGGLDSVGIVEMYEEDIVRSPLVKRIMSRLYERNEES